MEALRARGGDGAGKLELRGMQLGIQRLAITDPKADQPIVVGEAPHRMAVVLNGNLAHPKRWRRRLEELGHALQTHNDAEIPLRLYLAKGREGLLGLEGGFAFALFDEGEGGRLLLARDSFGEKPLFVGGQAGGFPSFASTPWACLLVNGGSAPSLTPTDVAQLLRFGWTDGEKADFGLGARELPRGELWEFGPEGLRTKLKLSPSSPPAPPDPIGADQATLDTCLLGAVAGRIQGDRPIGLLLSGGIDSAALAVALSRLGKRTPTFCLDFAGCPAESPRAKRVAAQMGHPFFDRTVGQNALLAWEAGVRAAGRPLADPSFLATYQVAVLAREQGIGILLSGEGGDEAFVGYGRQRILPWLALGRSLLPRPLRSALGALPFEGKGKRLALALEEEDPAQSYADLCAQVTLPDLRALLDLPQSELGQAELPRAFQSPNPDPLLQASLTEEQGYLPGDLCPKLDTATLMAGIEGRAPLLNRPLFTLARQMRDTHSSEREGKGPLRAWLAPYLPRELRHGRKRGFGPPIARWLAGSRYLDALLSDPFVRRHAPWNHRVSQIWLAELRRGRGDRALPLFALGSLAHFLRMVKTLGHA